MKSGGTLLAAVVALGLAGAGGYSVDRYLALDNLRAEHTLRVESLNEAAGLMERHTEAFEQRSAPADLKTVVQQASARNKIALSHLSEVEREAGEKTRERNVYARLVDVPHAKLVAFLADLELNGRGARIKDIRLVPDASRSDYYKEAESTLCVRWSTDTMGAKKGGGN